VSYEVELRDAGVWKRLVRCQSLPEAARQIRSMGHYGVESRVVLVSEDGRTVVGSGVDVLKAIELAPSAASPRF
jgi:hypothetical protein